jgi:hypothetical protein
MAKEEFCDVGQIPEDLVGFSHGDNSPVAVRVCIDGWNLTGIDRFQHMLPYDAFDPISSSKDASLGHIAIGECKDDFVWLLLDICQTLAEFDILDWNEAGHYVKQRLPVCLLDGVSHSASQQREDRDQPICDRS